ncbi:MAG: hypothetical protein Q8M29_19495 [Bacteroidota bacterium]|nr:hypothetical protein [Bacteroidota bacterium]
MKAKVILVAVGAILAVGIALHISHEPPKDGICPLGKAIHGK